MNAVVLLVAVASLVATGAIVTAVLQVGSTIAFLLAVFVATTAEVVALTLLSSWHPVLSSGGWQVLRRRG